MAGMGRWAGDVGTGEVISAAHVGQLGAFVDGYAEVLGLVGHS